MTVKLSSQLEIIVSHDGIMSNVLKWLTHSLTNMWQQVHVYSYIGMHQANLWITHSFTKESDLYNYNLYIYTY